LLDILKIDKYSTDIQCFIFQFTGFGALFWGARPTKVPPVATGLNIVKYDLALLFARDTWAPLDAIPYLHCYVKYSVLNMQLPQHYTLTLHM